jgi:hypothetical protein
MNEPLSSDHQLTEAMKAVALYRRKADVMELNSYEEDAVVLADEIERLRAALE